MAALLSRRSSVRPPLAPGVPISAGQVLAGRYRVEELLGCGASAIVLSARHVHLHHPVTVKLLTAYTDGQLDGVSRQIEKARIATRLRGEHVARILDIGTTEDGTPFIATEHLDGHTLEAELEAREKLPIEEALRLVLEACEGLAEAHARGLVHGDLKTKNLFLARRAGAAGEERVLKILDFGMASALDSASDASATAWFGMPSYLAPEQIRDPSSADARADIWALGVILHRLITGSLPFTADTVSGVLVAVCFDAAPLASEAPYELARVVHRCLEKDREKRPADVEELAAELARFLGPDGSRISERVRSALSTPPPSGDAPDLDADASGSIPAMAVAVPAERARPAWDRPTAPSQRVVARRRSRAARLNRLAIATVIAATAIAAATIIGTPPSVRVPRTTLASDDDEIVIPDREPIEVAPAVPHSFGDRAVVEVEVPESESPLAEAKPAKRPQQQAKRRSRGGIKSTSRLPSDLPKVRKPAAEPSRAKRGLFSERK